MCFGHPEHVHAETPKTAKVTQPITKLTKKEKSTKKAK